MFWLAGLLALGFWIASAHAFGWRQTLGVLSVALAGLLAWTRWRNSPVGQLSWDGQAWHWESRGYALGSAEHTVFVACDFQSVMLLRIENPAHARLWLWAEKRMLSERWPDFRRAVFSPHRAPAKDVSLA